jgi:hypothetical protein
VKDIIHGCSQDDNEFRKNWKEKRGLVTAPQEVLSAVRGATTFATVKIKNDTPRPYKPGFSVQSFYTGAALDALKQVVLPIDWQVNGHQEFTIDIPIEVSADAQFTANTAELEHVAEFSLMNAKGNPLGEKILIKFKVVEQIEEGEFFQRAVELFDSLSSVPDEGLFDLVVQSLKDADNCPKKAKELVEKKRSEQEAPKQE